jgi:clan AA aspartic protease (TIGR02281 family)
MIENDPDDNGLYYDKSCLLSRMGMIGDAIAALRTALEKGMRSFAHVENDDDMDPIRNHPDFITLIKEFKDKPIVTINGNEDSLDEISIISEVQMTKMYSGVYEVACTINGLPLKFVFDTGASSVSISSVEATFMLKNGYLTSDDIKGKTYFSSATGEIHEGTIIKLKEIKIGEAVLRNIEASVVQNQQAPLLLGQSVLERFGTITIDNINSKLIIKQ